MTADPKSDEARLRELAERLMTHPHPEGEITTQLFVGELPDGLGTDIPLPERAVLVGSQLRRLAGRMASMEAVFDVDGEPAGDPRRARCLRSEPRVGRLHRLRASARRFRQRRPG